MVFFLFFWPCGLRGKKIKNKKVRSCIYEKSPPDGAVRPYVLLLKLLLGKTLPKVLGFILGWASRIPVLEITEVPPNLTKLFVCGVHQFGFLDKLRLRC